MDNLIVNFKDMKNSEKIKLINNSLVLEGLTLKELSEKIGLEKLDLIIFMKTEGFFFDSIDGYFKKDREIPTLINMQPLTIDKNDSLNSKIKNQKKEKEDVQSIIDSINEKLNIKNVENTALLPEIKDIHTPSYSEKKKEENITPLSLEIPRISRSDRLKKKRKKNIFLRFTYFLKEKLSSISSPKKQNKKDKKLKKDTENIVLKEISVDKNLNCDSLKKDSSKKNKNDRKIKKAKNFKGKIIYPKKEDSPYKTEKIFSKAETFENLKKDLKELKKEDDLSPKENNPSLEERVSKLEKKVQELEDFFLEIFHEMSKK